ncbi:MAG: DUF721 domain-containing protein [Spirochaetaceae bacterium]|nr:MAG: DUF721 domain-containing protein [Spirochaetaceae bacterium]
MERAADILDGFFRRSNISGGRAHVAFYRSWEEIVGQDLASHTNLTEIRNNAVCIEIDHPAWMQMLQLRQAAILARIQKRFASLEVHSLQMRLVEKLGNRPPAAGPDSEVSPPLPARTPAPAPSGSEHEALERIESASLRATLRRLRAVIPDDHATRKDQDQ